MDTNIYRYITIQHYWRKIRKLFSKLEPEITFYLLSFLSARPCVSLWDSVVKEIIFVTARKLGPHHLPPAPSTYTSQAKISPRAFLKDGHLALAVCCHETVFKVSGTVPTPPCLSPPNPKGLTVRNFVPAPHSYWPSNLEKLMSAL